MPKKFGPPLRPRQSLGSASLEEYGWAAAAKIKIRPGRAFDEQEIETVNFRVMGRARGHWDVAMECTVGFRIAYLRMAISPIARLRMDFNFA